MHPSASDCRSEFAHCDLVPDNSDRCTCDKTQQWIRQYTHIIEFAKRNRAVRIRMPRTCPSTVFNWACDFLSRIRFSKHLRFAVPFWLVSSVASILIYHILYGQLIYDIASGIPTRTSSVNVNCTSCYSRCVLVSLWGRPIDPIAVASSSIITIGTHNGGFACFLMPLSNVYDWNINTTELQNTNFVSRIWHKIIFLIEKRKVVFYTNGRNVQHAETIN